MMKRILALFLVLIMALSLIACGNDTANGDETGTGSQSGNQSSEQTDKPSDTESPSVFQENTSSYENLLNNIKGDHKYKAWKYSGYERDLYFTYYVESYVTDSYTYYSVVCEAEGIDWLVRYDSESPQETLEAFCKGEWVECVCSFSVEEFTRKANYDRLLAMISGDGNFVDNTVKVYDNTYSSKRATIEENVYVDYLCVDGKWDSVALTMRGDGMVVFDSFVFSDSPAAQGRIFSSLECATNEKLVATCISSESMSPALELNNLYCFDASAVNLIEIGDVVLVYNKTNQFYFAHRVVQITDDGKYVLKGDKNDAVDANAVAVEDILGVLVSD